MRRQKWEQDKTADTKQTKFLQFSPQSQLANSPTSADEEAVKKREEDKGAYTKLWNEYGKALKMGVVEDTANRNRLAKLLRVRGAPRHLRL